MQKKLLFNIVLFLAIPVCHGSDARGSKSDWRFGLPGFKKLSERVQREAQKARGGKVSQEPRGRELERKAFVFKWYLQEKTGYSYVNAYPWSSVITKWLRSASEERKAAQERIGKEKKQHKTFCLRMSSLDELKKAAQADQVVACYQQKVENFLKKEEFSVEEIVCFLESECVRSHWVMWFMPGVDNYLKGKGYRVAGKVSSENTNRGGFEIVTATEFENRNEISRARGCQISVR